MAHHDALAINGSGCFIDEVGPLPIVRPAEPAEVGQLVRQAAAEGKGLFPMGGRTMLDVGLPPARSGIAVDLRGLDRIIDYPARDMTITVQAGITLTRLQEVLAPENQRLPVDVPLAGRATLGGALATNVSGPRRHGFGTLRDYVIGITTINDEGHEVKAGGRVVKNVAGYDLCKLHIGALGTLGIITRVTFKLRPLPEARALVTFGCRGSALASLLDTLHRSRTRPVCVDLLNAAAAAGLGLPDAEWVLAVGFEESEPCVEWQVRQLIGELPADSVQGLEARAGQAGESLWQSLVEMLLPADARLTFKANLLPSAVAGFCLQAAALHGELRLHAQAGAGIVRGHSTSLTMEQAQALLKELQPAATAAQGSVVVPRCPVAWKQSLSVWGPPRGDWMLMRQVIGQLDPRRLFNPGRYLQGL